MNGNAIRKVDGEVDERSMVRSMEGQLKER